MKESTQKLIIRIVTASIGLLLLLAYIITFDAFYIFALFVGLVCGFLNTRIAKSMDTQILTPYLLGFGLGLVGLFIFLIYYALFKIFYSLRGVCN